MRRTIRFDSIEQAYFFSGRHDENLKLLEESLGVQVAIRGQDIILQIKDEDADLVNKIVDRMLERVYRGESLSKEDVIYLIRDFKSREDLTDNDFRVEKIKVAKRGVPAVVPKTVGQRRYVSAIRSHDLVFALGPAGTGKTYLAMAMAVEALVSRRVRRIILTRPAVEAGERLGFLPGSLEEKMNPYLRPLYDALYDMMDPEEIEEYVETGVIEVAPLAFMRGRTLNHAFIILDEAQNCTPEQMKMFLTRLGFGSKAVVTGDLTQSDLIGGKPIGLLEAIEILKGIEGIEFVYLTGADVVRHELVQAIIEAYARYQEKKGSQNA